jgi:hypothetical protein
MPLDILLLEDCELAIVGGDFVIGEATLQHKRLLLLHAPGDMRNAPKRGVGIESYIDDDGADELLQAITAEFEADGLTIKGLKMLADGTIRDGSYYEGSTNGGEL